MIHGFKVTLGLDFDFLVEHEWDIKKWDRGSGMHQHWYAIHFYVVSLKCGNKNDNEADSNSFPFHFVWFFNY